MWCKKKKRKENDYGKGKLSKAELIRRIGKVEGEKKLDVGKDIETEKGGDVNGREERNRSKNVYKKKKKKNKGDIQSVKGKYVN